MNNPTVLCFSQDTALLMTRQWILERSNYSVLSVMSLPEYRGQVCRTKVDMVLLCQTLTDEECRSAVQFVQEQSPGTVWLVMYGSEPRALPPAWPTLSALSGPLLFLKAVDQMLLVEPALRAMQA